MLRATMFISSCLVLIAVAFVQCANVPTEKLTNAAVFDEAASHYDQDDAFPGRDITPGEQCQDRHYYGIAGVCKTDNPAARCAELICADILRSDIPEALETGPALDGTWCGDKKICLKGSCIVDPQPPENPLIIDDYQYGCATL